MRKLLSIILSIAILSALIPVMSVSAAGNEEALNEYKTLLAELEIVTQEPETVTREVFLIAVMRLLNVSGEGGYVNGFDDVDSDGELAFAIENALRMGIIAEDEGFYPEREITYSEANKILVCALGYEVYAQNKGGYPTGYNAVASSQLKLNKYLSGDRTGAVTTDDFYILLGNAANEEIMEFAGGSAGSVSYDKTKTLLDVKHDVITVEGIYEANEYTYMADSRENAGSDRVIIAGTSYEGTIENVPLGSNVKAYIRDNDDGTKVLCAFAEDNDEITVSSVEKPSFSAGMLYYERNGSQKNYKIATGAAVLYNGKALNGYTESDFAIKDGSILLIDNDCDGKYDVVHINESKFMITGNVADGVIYDSNYRSKLDLSDDETVYTITDAAGELIEADDVEAGSCIEYRVSKDGRLVSAKLLTETVKGIAESYDSSERTASLDGAEYDVTQYFAEVYVNEFKLGSELTIFVSSEGKLVAISGGSGSAMLYGYVYDTFNDLENSETPVGMRIFGEDGQFYTYYVSEKVVLNGRRDGADAVLTKISDTAQLIRYKIRDGIITKINTQSETMGIYDSKTESSDMLKRLNFSGYDGTGTVYYKITGYFVPHFTINDNTKIFCVNEGNNVKEKRYTLGSGIGFLSNDEKVQAKNIIAYNVNEVGVADAVVYIDDSGASVSSVARDSDYGVVKKAMYVINEDDEPIISLELYADDWYTTYYIEMDEAFLDTFRKSGGYSDSAIPFTAGDVIRYTTDIFGYIVDAEKDYDNKNKELISDYGNNYTDNELLKFYYGGLYSLSSSAIALFKLDEGVNGSKYYFPWGGASCCIVDEDNNVYTVPRSRMISYLNDASNYSRLLLKTRYASVQAVIIYE